MADKNTAKSHLETVSLESLKKSAASLGMMVRKEVVIEDFEMFDACDGMDELEQGQEILVTTEIIGDVNGKSYLMLSEEVGNLVYESVFGPRKPSITMEVVMKEVDNIVSAAMISVLADSFQVEIFGDVPYFFIANAAKSQDIISDDCINYANEEDKFFIKSKLVCKDKNIRMLFYWIISGEIMSKVDLSAK